jgi:hypothetical protein
MYININIPSAEISILKWHYGTIDNIAQGLVSSLAHRDVATNYVCSEFPLTWFSCFKFLFYKRYCKLLCF